MVLTVVGNAKYVAFPAWVSVTLHEPTFLPVTTMKLPTTFTEQIVPVVVVGTINKPRFVFLLKEIVFATLTDVAAAGAV